MCNQTIFKSVCLFVCLFGANRSSPILTTERNHLIKVDFRLEMSVVKLTLVEYRLEMTSLCKAICMKVGVHLSSHRKLLLWRTLSNSRDTSCHERGCTSCVQAACYAGC